MRPGNSPDEPSRFKGHMRHYHRGGRKPARSWDEWVGGRLANAEASRKWRTILVITVVIVLGLGIVAGIVIALR